MSGFLDNEENFKEESEIALEMLVELLSEKFQSERYDKHYIAGQLRRLGGLYKIQGSVQALRDLKEQNEKEKTKDSEN